VIDVGLGKGNAGMVVTGESQNPTRICLVFNPALQRERPATNILKA